MHVALVGCKSSHPTNAQEVESILSSHCGEPDSTLFIRTERLCFTHKQGAARSMCEQQQSMRRGEPTPSNFSVFCLRLPFLCAGWRSWSASETETLVSAQAHRDREGVGLESTGDEACRRGRMLAQQC